MVPAPTQHFTAPATLSIGLSVLTLHPLTVMANFRLNPDVLVDTCRSTAQRETENPDGERANRPRSPAPLPR